MRRVATLFLGLLLVAVLWHQAIATDGTQGTTGPAWLDRTTGKVFESELPVATTGHPGMCPQLSGSDSDVLKGDGTFGTVVAGELAWKTLYTVNLTTLGAQDLKSGGDGTKTVDGQSVEVINSASATTMALGNAACTGLYILDSAANTTYMTAPAVYWRLEKFSSSRPMVDRSWTKLKIKMIYGLVAAGVPNVSNAGVDIGFMLGKGGNDNMANGVVILAGYNDTNVAKIWTGVYNFGGSSAYQNRPAANTWGGSAVLRSSGTACASNCATASDLYDVVVVEGNYAYFTISTGKSSGGNFPADTAIYNIGSANIAQLSVMSLDVSGPWFEVKSGGTQGTSGACLKRLEIYYK